MRHNKYVFSFHDRAGVYGPNLWGMFPALCWFYATKKMEDVVLTKRGQPRTREVYQIKWMLLPLIHQNSSRLVQASVSADSISLIKNLLRTSWWPNSGNDDGGLCICTLISLNENFFLQKQACFFKNVINLQKKIQAKNKRRKNQELPYCQSLLL